MIARNGRPVARLVSAETPRRELGVSAGQITITEDFDAPLPEGLLGSFHGDRPA